MSKQVTTAWGSICNVPFRGLLIESNYSTEEAMVKNIKSNINTDILFISSNDGVTPTSYQGFNLEETKEIRNYLDNLISIAEKGLAE